MLHNTEYFEDAETFNASVARINKTFGKEVISLENTDESDSEIDIIINNETYSNGMFHVEVCGFLDGFETCLDVIKELKK